MKHCGIWKIVSTRFISIKDWVSREHREGWIVGQGSNFFHIENRNSIHAVIRGGLSLPGLRKRGQRNALAIELERLDIHLRGLPNEFAGYTLLHLSDLHLDINGQMPAALVSIIESLYLSGIDDPHYFRSDNMERACDSVPREAISILLSHSPEIYGQAASARFDLMLCEHTHGGQICLPGGVPLIVNANCPRQYGKGLWRFEDLQGYTSAGSGASVVDIRLNCPPQVLLLRLMPDTAR